MAFGWDTETSWFGRGCHERVRRYAEKIQDRKWLDPKEGRERVERRIGAALEEPLGLVADVAHRERG
jgi:hypothetical protein